VDHAQVRVAEAWVWRGVLVGAVGEGIKSSGVTDDGGWMEKLSAVWA
jgi:hypothetical protein